MEIMELLEIVFANTMNKLLIKEIEEIKNINYVDMTIR